MGFVTEENISQKNVVSMAMIAIIALERI